MPNRLTREELVTIKKNLENGHPCGRIALWMKLSRATVNRYAEKFGHPDAINRRRSNLPTIPVITVTGEKGAPLRKWYKPRGPKKIQIGGPIKPIDPSNRIVEVDASWVLSAEFIRRDGLVSMKCSTDWTFHRDEIDFGDPPPGRSALDQRLASK